MRVKNLDVGLERISRWQVNDEVHLPKAGPLAPSYIPQRTLLNDILERPSLDQRLIRLMQPRTLDSDLLGAMVLSAVRREIRALFRREAAQRKRTQRQIFEQAEKALAEDAELDDAVREALAALLRG